MPRVSAQRIKDGRPGAQGRRARSAPIPSTQTRSAQTRSSQTGAHKKEQLRGSCSCGGRYWDRTSDLFRVREARYRCANRPLHPIETGNQGFHRGGYGIRTRVYGFAGRCLASRPTHRVDRIPKNLCRDSVLRADDEIRTRDIHLGKVVLYQLSYVRIVGVHFLAAFGISSRSNE